MVIEIILCIVFVAPMAMCVHHTTIIITSHMAGNLAMKLLLSVLSTLITRNFC